MEVLQEQYKDTKVGVIPKDWEVVKIGKVADSFGGTTPSTTVEEYWDGDILWATPTDITKNKNEYLLETVRKITEQGRASKNLRFVKKNGLLMTSRASIGFLNISNGDVVTNQGFINIECKTTYHYKFFYYWVLNNRNLLIRLSQGSTFLELNRKTFAKINIPLPPLPEQQKIAEILSTVDEQISTTQAIIDKSKELKKGLMQKLFSEGIGHTEFKDTKIGRMPMEWDYTRIEEHINLFYGNAFKSSDFNEDGIGTKLLRGVNITVGRLRWTKKMDRYLNLPYEDYAKYGAEEGDLVISMDGSLVGRNFARVNKSDLPLLIVQRVACIRAKKSLNLEYLKQLVGSRLFLNYVDAVKTNSGIPHISGKDIKHFKIPFPSLSEQDKIGSILSEADAKIEKEEQEKVQLEQLKKGLMQQLLTGQKRVKV